MKTGTAGFAMIGFGTGLMLGIYSTEKFGNDKAEVKKNKTIALGAILFGVALVANHINKHV